MRPPPCIPSLLSIRLIIVRNRIECVQIKIYPQIARDISQRLFAKLRTFEHHARRRKRIIDVARRVHDLVLIGVFRTNNLNETIKVFPRKTQVDVIIPWDETLMTHSSQRGTRQPEVHEPFRFAYLDEIFQEYQLAFLQSLQRCVIIFPHCNPLLFRDAHMRVLCVDAPTRSDASNGIVTQPDHARATIR